MYGLPSTSHFSPEPEPRIINTPLFPLDNRHTKSHTSWHNTFMASRLERTPTPPPLSQARTELSSIAGSSTQSPTRCEASTSNTAKPKTKHQQTLELMRKYLKDTYPNVNLNDYISKDRYYDGAKTGKPAFDRVIAIQMHAHVKNVMKNDPPSKAVLSKALGALMKEIIESK